MQSDHVQLNDTQVLMWCAHLLLQMQGGESSPSQYIIVIEGGAHGRLGAGHLADHPAAVAALQGAVKVGDPLGPLLVLERVEVGVLPLAFASSSSCPTRIVDAKNCVVAQPPFT